jgi:hypothetical protein
MQLAPVTIEHGGFRKADRPSEDREQGKRAEVCLWMYLRIEEEDCDGESVDEGHG